MRTEREEINGKVHARRANSLTLTCKIECNHVSMQMPYCTAFGQAYDALWSTINASNILNGIVYCHINSSVNPPCSGPLVRPLHRQMNAFRFVKWWKCLYAKCLSHITSKRIVCKMCGSLCSLAALCRLFGAALYTLVQYSALRGVHHALQTNNNKWNIVKYCLIIVSYTLLNCKIKLNAHWINININYFFSVVVAFLQIHWFRPFPHFMAFRLSFVFQSEQSLRWASFFGEWRLKALNLPTAVQSLPLRPQNTTHSKPKIASILINASLQFIIYRKIKPNTVIPTKCTKPNIIIKLTHCLPNRRAPTAIACKMHYRSEWLINFDAVHHHFASLLMQLLYLQTILIIFESNFINRYCSSAVDAHRQTHIETHRHRHSW